MLTDPATLAAIPATITLLGVLVTNVAGNHRLKVVQRENVEQHDVGQAIVAGLSKNVGELVGRFDAHEDRHDREAASRDREAQDYANQTVKAIRETTDANRLARLKERGQDERNQEAEPQPQSSGGPVRHSGSKIGHSAVSFGLVRKGPNLAES